MNDMNGNGNGQTNGNTPPIVLAGFGCLLCLPIVYLATRPVVWAIHAQWIYSLLAPLFILLPTSAAFVILYRSLWHREWARSKRVLSLILVSGLIFCAVLLVIGMVVAAGSLYMGGALNPRTKPD
jgi:hypothetical protein